MPDSNKANCPRCGYFWRKCRCEESLRPQRQWGMDETRFEPDEDYQSELDREYDHEPRSEAYWRGYSLGRRGARNISCPYTEQAERTDFYRGVSDARPSRTR